MAEAEGKDTRSLEMRIAELEDKLAKLHITDDEMRAYQKVASLMGGGAGTGAAAGSADASAAQLTSAVCQIARSRLVCISPRQIVRFNECTCGPCIQGGGWGGDSGGGFGNFGS